MQHVKNIKNLSLVLCLSCILSFGGVARISSAQAVQFFAYIRILFQARVIYF